MPLQEKYIVAKLIDRKIIICTSAYKEPPFFNKYLKKERGVCYFQTDCGESPDRQANETNLFTLTLNVEGK